MRGSGRRTAAGLAWVLALSWVAGPAYAAAGDPVTGYWSRTRTGLPVPLQPPSPVPEGGTWVSADPTGPVTVSALRAELAAGLVAVELRLPIADRVGTPAVEVCPTTDRWAPEQDGRLEGAPAADCSTPGKTTVEQDLLVVPLPAGLDVVDVLLRPAPGSVFSLTLERATAASVVSAPAPAAAPPPGPSPGPGPAAPPPGQGEPLPLPPLSSGSAGLDLGSLAAPSEPLLAAPALPPAAAPAPLPAPEAAPPPAELVLAARPPAVVDDRSTKLVASALLAMLMALSLQLARRPARPPRALGGSARRSRIGGGAAAVPAGPPRGVGRFRSSRTRPPVRV